MSSKGEERSWIARQVEEDYIWDGVAGIGKIVGRDEPLRDRADQSCLLETGQELLRAASIRARDSCC